MQISNSLQNFQKRSCKKVLKIKVRGWGFLRFTRVFLPLLFLQLFQRIQNPQKSLRFYTQLEFVRIF